MALSESKKSGIETASKTAITKLKEMSEKSEVYAEYLKFQGRVYKHNANVALEFFAQRPNTEYIATATQWNAVGFKIKDGEEAIRFTNIDGNKNELFDFSQVVPNNQNMQATAPPLWTLNKENVSSVKNALEIPEKTSLIGGMSSKSFEPSVLAENMAELQVAPKDFECFRKSFISAVQTVLAGRFEIGGSKFNVNPDVTIFKLLDEERQIGFLTLVSEFARKLLRRVEKIANELNAKNFNERLGEQNDLSEMGESHAGRTGEYAGKRASGNSTGGTEKLLNPLENDNVRGREILGNNVGGRDSNETLSGVQKSGSSRDSNLVQVQSALGDLRDEFRGGRTIDDTRANRDLRDGLDEVDGGKSQEQSGEYAAKTQVFDGSESSGQGGVEFSGTIGRTIRDGESTPVKFRGNSEVGTNERILHGQRGDEGESVSSGDRSIEKLNNLLTDYDEENDKKELSFLTFQIANKQQEFSALIANGDYENSTVIAEELAALSQQAQKVKERVQARTIKTADVEVLRSIEPKRKSVQNLLEKEVAQTAKFEKLLDIELGKLSPYELRKQDKRAEETATVPVIIVEKRDVSKQIIERDKKNKIIPHGNFTNNDTEIIVNFGRVGIDDTNRQTRNVVTRSALYHAQEIVENAVCFDSVLSENKKNSPNSLFMHHMFGILRYEGVAYLAKLFVEETYLKNENNQLESTSNRLYNLKSIKISPIAHGLNPVSTNNVGAVIGDVISISQLRAIVKAFDKNFYENLSAPGRKHREAEIINQEKYTEAVEEFKKVTTNGKNFTQTKREIAPNQGTLFDFDATDERKVTTNGNFLEEKLADNQHIEKIDDVEFVYTTVSSSPPKAEQNAEYSLYTATKEQHPDHIVLMRLGDFYEAFEKDAELLSEKFEFTLANRAGHTMCGFPVAKLEQNIENLTANGLSVVCVEQDGDVQEYNAIEQKQQEQTAETASDKKVTTNGNFSEIMNDSHFKLRQVLNDFSIKHGLGELNIEESGYSFTLIEQLKGENDFIQIGEIDVPESGYGVPHTPETLKAALEAFEEKVPDLAQRHNRKKIIETKGGISSLPPVAESANTFHEIIYAKNPTDRFNDNIAALRELKRIENALAQGYEPYASKYNSKEESEKRLSKYCGWGGLPQVFDSRSNVWANQRTTLKNLLTPEEYTAARESTLNAHYTPQVIIDAMYEAIKNMNLPRDAKILEPSCGTGNFIRRLPAAFNKAKVTGVEIDDITAKIAKHLNPNAQILHSGFEHSNLDNDSFELAVGNVPFGDYNLNDPDYKQDWRIHDAFFRKALDKVAPGGVVAFVTSSGTLDKSNPKIREYLATKAELIGAIRLPNNAFASAGTKVTADIIFLQKRQTPLLPYEKKPEWCYITPNADNLKINSYFVNNPQMLLGKMEKTAHFDMLTCTPFEKSELKLQLGEAIKNINAKITVEKREKTLKERSGVIEADGKIKSFTFGKIDGKLYYREGAKMTEVKDNKKNLSAIELLCALREETRNLINLQKTSVPDENLTAGRENLNKLYDNFKAEYDCLNSDIVKKLFSKDADYPLLQGLEKQVKYDGMSTSKTYEKADIFFRRTVNAQVEITAVANIEEALQISLDRRGKPNVQYMAELLNREPEEVCKELFQKGYAFRDPDKIIADVPYSGIVDKSEYLSGNVRQKLVIAETYKTANLDYARNIEALEKVIPEDIKAENISARMGVPWIDGEDYTKFLVHLNGRRSLNSRNCEVNYVAATGEFEVMSARSKLDLNPNETTTYGTSDYSLYQLAEKILNQRRIVVKRDYPHPTNPGSTVTKTDPRATKNALEKARKIKEEFEKWIFADDKRRNKYERKYNDLFNCLVGREYDGSRLTFPGMNVDFVLREHQKNAIARNTLGGNSLVAHVVGAGKSAVMFATVMRKKELGLIQKACMVVPKALTEQTANEWRKLYPDAQLLTVTNDDLSNESKRNLFTARVATGSYDAVILSQEQYEKIPMSYEYRAEYMYKQLDALEDMLRDRKRDSKGKSDPTIKQLEAAKKRLKSRIERFTNPKSAAKAKDNLLEFEQLGFDYLVADEAHAYKNGFVMTKMTNVAGVTTRPSGRAEDMQMKTDYFNEHFGQGHILMATGTPVSNSMTELYVMTRYLRPDLLKQAGISRFDEWAATFGNVTTQLEPTAYEKYKLKTRFSQFSNLPELMAFYKEFADIKSAAKLELPRPTLKNGKNTIINIIASPEQKAYVRELSERAEAINSGAVKPDVDNFLKITGEARLIGLGNEAVKSLYAKRGEKLPPDFIDTKGGKADVCVNQVYEIWNESKNNKGVQLIFSDVAVSDEDGKYSVYEHIKRELIAKGVPENEIIFAPKADSKNRENIFKKINSGEYRVVIASTGTLGTGANIQERLIALHHCDIPWKPSDFEQREGRILRQGNTNKEVQIFNYVTEGTLDSYLYSTVTNKARFIAQILDNECPARVSEDCDEKVLTYAEIQAISAGNPDIRERIDTENKLAELHMLKREWGYEAALMRSRSETIPKRIEELKSILSKVEIDKESANDISEIQLKTSAESTLYERADIDKLLLTKATQAVSEFKKGNCEEIKIGDIGKFSLSVKAENGTKCFQDYSTETFAKLVIKGMGSYNCEAGLGMNDRNIVRLENLLKGIPQKEKSLETEIKRLTENLEQTNQQLKKSFEHDGEIEKLSQRLAELDMKLSGITEQNDVVIDPEEEKEPLVETADEKAAREKIYDTDDNDYQPVPENSYSGNSKNKGR